MSHLRPDERSRRHRKSDCRKGRHFYGELQHIGGGITRQICKVCGAVSIDLTNVYDESAPVRSQQKRSYR